MNEYQYNGVDLDILWDQLSEIPVDNNDDTEAPFLHFPQGTDKLEIWAWFEAQGWNWVEACFI